MLSKFKNLSDFDKKIIRNTAIQLSVTVGLIVATVALEKKNKKDA